MGFRITHEAPKIWAVDRLEEKWFRSRWVPVGTFGSEREAMDCVRLHAERTFRPHTTYYNKDGSIDVPETDW